MKGKKRSVDKFRPQLVAGGAGSETWLLSVHLVIDLSRTIDPAPSPAHKPTHVGPSQRASNVTRPLPVPLRAFSAPSAYHPLLLFALLGALAAAVVFAAFVAALARARVLVLPRRHRSSPSEVVLHTCSGVNPVWLGSSGNGLRLTVPPRALRILSAAASSIFPRPMIAAKHTV